MVRCANMDLDNFEKIPIIYFIRATVQDVMFQICDKWKPNLAAFYSFVFELMQSHDLSSKDNDLFSGPHPCQMESHGGR